MIMEERMSHSLLVVGLCVWLASPACGFFWPIPDMARPYKLPMIPPVQSEQPADIEVPSPSTFQLKLQEKQSLGPEQKTEVYTDHTKQTSQHTEETTVTQASYDTLTDLLKSHVRGPEKAGENVTAIEEATNVGNTTVEARHDASNPEVEYMQDIYDPKLRKPKKADESHKIFADFYQDVNKNENISDDPILKILDRAEAVRSWTENTGETTEGTEVGGIHVFEGMRSKRREMLRHSTNARKLYRSRAEEVEKGENTYRQEKKDLSVSRSGSPPLHNSVNRVVLPDGDELSTFTGYPNGIVNSYTEVCTCNCNNFPNLVTPPEPRCRWEMVFKAVAGNGRSVYDDFMSGNFFNTHHPEAREINNERPYKDVLKLEFWNELIIHQVRIDVYKQTARMAWFLFDAIGADKLNWMRSYRIISSSYTSLRDYDFNEVSVEGFGDQRFVMNIDNDDCCDHAGFLEVQDPLTSPPCCDFQDYADRPYFLYSAYTDDYGYFETSGDYGIGDRFVISIKTCDGDW